MLTPVDTPSSPATDPVAMAPTLEPFRKEHAPIVATWVDSNATLNHVAPNTAPPITPGKVLDWVEQSAHALVLLDTAAFAPLAYGEINRMKQRPDHYWLGHILLDPRRRRTGLGTAFIRRLLTYAQKELRARGVSLIVFPDNLAAVRCYERAGMKCTGTEYHEFGRPARRHKLLRFESTGRS